jgi:hypothetical protein
MYLYRVVRLAGKTIDSDSIKVGSTPTPSTKIINKQRRKTFPISRDQIFFFMRPIVRQAMGPS